MIEDVRINRLNHTDLVLYQCGSESCASGHSYGPAVRDHFLIHFILKGKGIFKACGKTYHLSENQGFLIYPDMITYYKADDQKPWHYIWVGFHGLKAELYLKHANLTPDYPVFKCEDDFIKNCFLNMISTKQLSKSRELRLLGYLYMFLSQLIEVSGSNFSDKETAGKELYVKKALEYIDRNYFRDISIEDISDFAAVNRKYLSSVFKACLSTTPQEYLINFRINRACELFKNKELSIGDISRSVGYADPLLFSKTFKRIKGTSPREYRKGVK